MQKLKNLLRHFLSRLIAFLDLNILQKIADKLLWYRLRLLELIRKKEALVKGEIEPPIQLREGQVLHRQF